jgi:hypothetical protein
MDKGHGAPARPLTATAPAATAPPARTLLAEMLLLAASEELSIRFQARGGSMRPFIRNGDILTISPLAGRSPRLGEVIAFFHPISGQVIVHRLIRRRGGLFWMQGDSVGDREGPVERGQILGYVSGLERAGRPRRLGLGPERVLIAGVTRTSLLFRPLRSAAQLLRRALFRTSSPGSTTDKA